MGKNQHPGGVLGVIVLVAFGTTVAFGAPVGRHPSGASGPDAGPATSEDGGAGDGSARDASSAGPPGAGGELVRQRPSFQYRWTQPLGERDPSKHAVRILLYVVLVCALAVGVLLVLRSLGGLNRLGRGNYVRIVESLPIGAKRQLVLARVGDRCLLVGVADGGITMLADVTSALPMEELDAPAHRQQNGFSGVLAQMCRMGTLGKSKGHE